MTKKDDPGNDTFATATPIVYTTEVQNGTLDASDIIDYYLLENLVGDTLNEQKDSQVIEIQVRRTGGGDIVAVIYEPNKLVIGTIHSSGEWGKIEFVVPYDGDYYLEISSDPMGGSSSYEFLMGGELGFDNRPYTKNNRPGEFVFTQTRKVSLSLNPVKNIVDYYTIDLPPKWGLEAKFQSDYPLSLSVLTSSYDLFGAADRDDPVEVKNSGTGPLRAHVRMGYPLFGNISYESLNRPYDLYMNVWSFETGPQIMEQWSEVRTIEEDPAQPLRLNLSQHFTEENGDPLNFAILSHHTGLSVELNNVTTPYGDPLYTEAIVNPYANWFGEEDILFQCWDRDHSIQDGLKVKVSSVNDLPFVTKIGKAVYEGGLFNIGVPEDEFRTYTIEYNDVDDPVEGISFSVSLSIPFFDLNPHNGTIRISPQQRHVGYYEFDLIVLDPSGGSIEIPINMTIMPVNDRPLRPEWSVLSGNITSILPGESISLRASSDPDPDGDALSFIWDWGDGSTTEGETGTHTYKQGFYGKRFVRLISSDGEMENETQIEIFINSPEDIAVGDMDLVIYDANPDCIEFREEVTRTMDGKNSVVFRIIESVDPSIDLVSVRTIRRGNELQVYLQVDGTIETDGQHRYHIFILSGGWAESQLDVNMTKGWGDIPLRNPGENVIATRSYLGALDINSTGIIMGGDTIVFTIDIMDLNRSGTPLPLNRSNIQVFAYSEHTSEHFAGKAALLSLAYDSAGDGSVPAPNVYQPELTGEGSSPIGDFAKGPGLLVFIALLLIMLVMGIIGYVLSRRERKKKREEEEKFVKEVEQMRAEGRDLFDRVKEEGPKKVSYQELYGQAPPKDYKPKSEVEITSLPGPGLAGAGIGQGPVEAVKHDPQSVAKPIISGNVNWEE